MGHLDVSVIIVNWNTQEILRDCLKSVYEETRDISFEVVVVDNASSDGSVEMVQEKFPQVILIENTENRGFAAANNQGMCVARGRYVLLLNSDTIVLDGAIQKTIAFADQHTEAAVVGCKTFYPDGALQRNCFMYPALVNMLLSAFFLNKLFPRNKFFGRERMAWWDLDDVREVEVVCGCYALVRSEAIDQVGMMEERLFMYGDDPDWCFRFKKAGWKTLFTPDAEIIHWGGQSTKGMAREFRWQQLGSVLIFFRLHRSRLSFYLACFLMSLSLTLRVPYWLCVGLLSNKNRTKAMYTAGTYFIGAWHCLTNWRKLLMKEVSI